VFGELSKNIELRYSCQPSSFASFSLNRLHSFISLRGSKEALGHSARAKSLGNILIRTAQKTQKSGTAIAAAEHSAPAKNSPSARTPQAPFNCSNLGLESDPPSTPGQPKPQTSIGKHLDCAPTTVRQPYPMSISSLSQPSSAKPCCLVLTYLSSHFTSLQHRATKRKQPPKSAYRPNLAPALNLSASAALPCDFLRIATPPQPRNLSPVDNSRSTALILNNYAAQK
jgi:hypothetical protein